VSAHTPGCHHGEPLTPPAKIATWLPCPLCDAAEDLLAALKALRNWANALNGGEGVNSEGRDALDELVSARAAIAKAEGQEGSA